MILLYLSPVLYAISSFVFNDSLSKTYPCHLCVSLCFNNIWTIFLYSLHWGHLPFSVFLLSTLSFHISNLTHANPALSSDLHWSTEMKLTN